MIIGYLIQSCNKGAMKPRWSFAGIQPIDDYIKAAQALDKLKQNFPNTEWRLLTLTLSAYQGSQL